MAKFQKGHMPSGRIKPGEVRNPHGNRFGSFKARIKKIAEMKVDIKDLDNKDLSTTAGEAVILALYHKAIFKKDSNAARILMEYSEEKKVTHVGDPDNPIQLEFNVKRAHDTLELIAAARKAGLGSAGELGSISGPAGAINTERPVVDMVSIGGEGMGQDPDSGGRYGVLRPMES